jgi:hypothetical protein
MNDDQKHQYKKIVKLLKGIRKNITSQHLDSYENIHQHFEEEFSKIPPENFHPFTKEQMAILISYKIAKWIKNKKMNTKAAAPFKPKELK